MNSLTKETVKAAIETASDLSKKEFELRKARVEVQHEKLTQQLRELEGFKTFKIGTSEARLNSLMGQNREYIAMAKTGSVFLNIKEFKGLVPLFPRNMILIGAETGDGKSTLTANMTFQFLAQNQRVLVITNEEHPTDVINRVIFLSKGWSYHDHTTITPDQQAELDRLYPVIAQRLEVIDDAYNGVGGLTTTVEGHYAIQKSLLEGAENPFNIIIIDYFQNANSSNKNPSASGFEVLHEVGRSWDIFKTKYPAPIIMLSQLKAVKDDENIPFKERIEGRKSIYNFCTCAIQVKANKQDRTTEWSFKKSRFAQSIGVTVKTGFDRGRYVEYNREFAKKVEEEKMARTMAEIRKTDSAKINEMLGIKSKEKEHA